jgi:cysteinyl-tRNA synthetase
MVNVGGQKMSKSLGNFTTIRALLESGVSAMTLRLFVLQAHYRKPLDFTPEALDAAATGWKGLNAALQLTDVTGESQASSGPQTEIPQGLSVPLADARNRFAAALNDDLNTSAALAVLFELAKPLRALANRIERGDPAASAEAHQSELVGRRTLLQELTGVLGLKIESEPTKPAAGAEGNSGTSDAEIQAQIEARLAAKAAKNFQEADRIRDALKAQGIELIDKSGGLTEWLWNG